MSDLYFCPTVGEIESARGGGFDTCCAHPDLHVSVDDSPGIQAISQYLSDKAREEHAGPPVHEGQNDPTTIQWVSDADEAHAELLRLQKVARYYRDHAQHLLSHRWAETIHTEDDGLLHLPVYTPKGTEAEGLVLNREDAVVLHAMIENYLDDCPSSCDDDCTDVCHEAHAVPRRRHHPIGMHPTDGTALDYVAEAVARHDLVHVVGLEPHQELPAPDHHFWNLWRATARVAITAYNGYVQHTGHRYLSTGCRHGEHGYCQSNTGSQGQKRPAECKFCAAPCVCSCHFLGAKTAPGQMKIDDLTTGTDDDMCGAEPPQAADDRIQRPLPPQMRKELADRLRDRTHKEEKTA